MLFSLGHSTLSVPEFLALAADLDVIVDVRSFPGSRRYPHFARESMAEWLPAAGIVYEWQPALGGRRKAPDPPPTSAAGSGHLTAADISAPGRADAAGGWHSAGFSNYAAAMMQADWLAAADDLATRAGDPGPPALAFMCAEALWWRCHRSMIADYLVWRGFQVCHLQPKPTLHGPAVAERLERYHPAVIQAWETWRADHPANGR